MSTLRDVAAMARVSVSTASRYVRQDGYVSPEAGKRIRAAMRQLGYHPNGVARSLRHRRTNTLALVVPEIENPFFTTVSRGVEDVANASGYAVIYCNTDEQDEKQDRYLHMLLERKVDGLLFVPCGRNAADHCRMLTAAGVPYVFIDRHVPGYADAVLGDNIGGAQQITHHLLTLRHERIGLIGGNPYDSVSRERRSGYEAALAHAGVTQDPTLVCEGDWSMDSARQFAHILLARDAPPTALFCTNNVLAVGALLALREAGRRVPEDVALVCFDDVELASLMDPFLTVAVQPAYEMGCRAATILLDRIARRRDGEPAREVLPVQLIIRRSCGAQGTVDLAPPPADRLPGRRWRADRPPPPLTAADRTTESGARARRAALFASGRQDDANGPDQPPPQREVAPPARPARHAMHTRR